jgi:hypothetical protein
MPMKKQRRRQIALLLVDAVFVFLSLLLTLGVVSRYRSVRFDAEHMGMVMVYWMLWMGVTVISGKFRISEQLSLRKTLLRIIYTNLYILFGFVILVLFYSDPGISRAMLFAGGAVITAAELLVGLSIYNIQNSYFIQEWIGPGQFTGMKAGGLVPPADLQHREFPKLKQPLLDAITRVTGPEACEWICSKASLDDPQTLLLDTSTRFTVLNQPESLYSEVVNIQRINDIRRINQFFEAVNGKLPAGGLFVGCGDTYRLRKQKIMKRFPPVVNYLVYIPDFIYHRVMPKLTVTNKLYFLLSKGKNRVISRTEILGRLISCGFEILDEKTMGDLLWFRARKVRQPYFDNDPSYGMLIRLRRVGKGGQPFNVFKFRTMHPYSEYLQEYLYREHNLAEGGKFGTDYRVTTIGRFFRKYWLDELPMLINLAAGDIKMVGVRPISAHYFSLYSGETQKERIRHKPGLIPPYYAQYPVPKTLEEIEQNELTYLRRYEQHPVRTDVIYFHRAVYNIIFRRARSK